MNRRLRTTFLAWAGAATAVSVSAACACADGVTRTSDLRILFDQAIAEFDEALGLALQHQPDRARRLFLSAAQRLETIAAAGVVNGRLEYNLGNCYLQAGDAGRAMLHYKRAQRLMPRDPMLKDNLSQARSRCLTTIAPTRRSAVLESVLFWHYQIPISTRAQAATAGYVLFWALLIGRGFRPSRALGTGALICVFLSAAAAGSVAVSGWSDRHAPEGVVTSMDVVVYKGPGAAYQRQFEQPLQPGAEFTVRERTAAGWWRIELPDGKTGWIEARQGELVPPDA